MKDQAITLIDVLIVSTVIVVMATIVIPPMLRAGKGAREEALRADLEKMRVAIASYEKDRGEYPAKLGLIVTTSRPGRDVPYLATEDGKLPYNYAVSGKEDEVRWTYDPETGTVHSWSGRAANGDDYSTW